MTRITKKKNLYPYIFKTKQTRYEQESIIRTNSIDSLFFAKQKQSRKFYAITYVSFARRILHMGEINFDLNSPRVRILREDGPQYFPTFQQLLQVRSISNLFDLSNILHVIVNRLNLELMIIRVWSSPTFFYFKI